MRSYEHFVSRQNEVQVCAAIFAKRTSRISVHKSCIFPTHLVRLCVKRGISVAYVIIYYSKVAHIYSTVEAFINQFLQNLGVKFWQIVINTREIISIIHPKCIMRRFCTRSYKASLFEKLSREQVKVVGI